MAWKWEKTINKIAMGQGYATRIGCIKNFGMYGPHGQKANEIALQMGV